MPKIVKANVGGGPVFKGGLSDPESALLMAIVSKQSTEE